MIDLSALPIPQVIEELDYEAIVDRQKTKFQQLWETVRLTYPNLPPYNVSMLESDPAMIIIEAESYRELLLRARANAVAKANILPWSTGNDLITLAAGHGVEVIPGESEDRLKKRIILKEQGSSAAGPPEWYKYWAMTASLDVADVAVYRSGPGPEITLAILSVSNGGVASDALLEAVRVKVTADDIAGENDVISVTRAVTEVVNITGDIWLLPDTPMSVFDGLEQQLRDKWAAESGIGFDMLLDWIKSKLMTTGVYKVVLSAPLQDKIANSFSAFAIGTVHLNFNGRGR